MKKSQLAKEIMWQEQGIHLRNPLDIYGCSAQTAKWTDKNLKYTTHGKFIEVLEGLQQTLLVSREYEHLVLSLNAKEGQLHQRFISLPHPSGIAVSPDQRRIYIASTRNPNMIMEMGPTDGMMTRLEDKHSNLNPTALMPLRSKYFPGAYYFHDLVFINNELYANSVGQNGVVKINMNDSSTDPLFWQIRIDGYTESMLSHANYIQLNSIAAGATFDLSYFSASVEKPGKYRPGDSNFPVDGKGVIFDAESNVIGRGLTRPHSARLFQNELWVNNSGYGEVGIISDGRFNAIAKLPGWTRGLKFIGHYAFVGYSVILKKYTQYAPGINYDEASCGIAIINTLSGAIEGRVEFPYGNQIFQIEAINSDISNGFLYSSTHTDTNEHNSQHYKYIINR